MIIKSKTNSQIKEINKLKHKKYREEKQKFIAEGKKIVEEALEFQNENVEKIFASVSYAKGNNIPKEAILVEDEIFSYITEDTNPEGILAIIKIPKEQNIDYSKKNIVILNEIRDPGNMGTILRTLDSLGITQVVLTGDIVDPYMPKVVRSSMGAIFRINIIKRHIIKEIKNLKERNFKVVCTDMEGENIYTLDNGKYAIIFNNESHGISEDIEDLVSGKISIPMEGKTESLNVAMSVGIIMYEFYRKEKFN